MKTALRLDTISENLAAAFEVADEFSRRQAVLEACMTVVAENELKGEIVESAINYIRVGGLNISNVRHDIDMLTVQFDDNYFRLKEEADDVITTESLREFRRARTCAALSFGLTPESEQLHESIYEALVASSNASNLVQRLEAILDG